MRVVEKREKVCVWGGVRVCVCVRVCGERGIEGERVVATLHYPIIPQNQIRFHLPTYPVLAKFVKYLTTVLLKSRSSAL